MSGQTDEMFLRPSGMLLCLAGLAVALWPVLAQPPLESSIWVAETLAVILFASGMRIMYEQMDLTEPVHWANGVMTLMFVVHPYLRLSTGGLA